MQIAAAGAFIQILAAGGAKTLAILAAQVFVRKLKQNIRTEKLVQIQRALRPYLNDVIVLLLLCGIGENVEKPELIPPFRQRGTST